MDGWGDVGGWDDDTDDRFLRPAAITAVSDDDDDLLNMRAQEACEDAGIADTLREMYRVNLAATTIQVAWQNFTGMRREKKRMEEEMEKQRKEQKFNLFSWAEDQRTQWDIVNAWRPSGATSGGAFTKFEAMDWSERKDQLWRVAKFFIDRGMWVPGQNGGLTEKQMQDLLKMEAGWISAVSSTSDGFGKFEYMSWAADIQGSLSGQKGPAWGRSSSRHFQGSAWEPGGPEESRASPPTAPHRSAAASHPKLPDRPSGEHQEDGKSASSSVRPQRSFLLRKDSLDPRAAARQPQDPRDPLLSPSGEDSQRRAGARDEMRGGPGANKAGSSRSGSQRTWSPPEEVSLAPLSGTRPPRDHKYALEKRAASRQSPGQSGGRQDRAETAAASAESAAPQIPTRVPPPGAVRPAAFNAHANRAAAQKLSMDSAPDAEHAGHPSHLEHIDHQGILDAHSGGMHIDVAASAGNSTPRLNPSPRGAQHDALGASSAPHGAANLARTNRGTIRVTSASSASSSGSDMSPSGYGRHRLPSLDSPQQHGRGSDEGRHWRSSGDSEEALLLAPNSDQQPPMRRQVMIRTTSLIPSDRAQTPTDQGTPGAAHGTSWMLQIQEANAVASSSAQRQARGSSGSSTPSQNYYSPRSSTGDQVQVSDEIPWPHFAGRIEHPQDLNLALVTGRSIHTAHSRYGSPEARRRGRPRTEASKSSPSTPSNSTSHHHSRGMFEVPVSPKRPGTTTGCGIEMHIPLKNLSVFQGNERQKSMPMSRQNAVGRQQQQQPASRGALGKDLRTPENVVFSRGVKRGKAPTMRTKGANSMASMDPMMSSPLVVREWQPYSDRGQQQMPHHQQGPIIYYTASKASPSSPSAAKRAWRQPERTAPVSYYSRPLVDRARNPLDHAVRNAVYRSAGASPSPQPEPRIHGNIRHTVLLREKPASVALSEHRRRMGL